MSLQHTIELFTKINNDCKSTGENVVPLTSDNIDYYIDQMENLNFTNKAQDEFINWLELQH